MAGGSKRKGSKDGSNRKGSKDGSNRKGSKGSENVGVGEGGFSKEVLGEDSGANVASTLVEMEQSGVGEGPSETVGDVSRLFSEGDFVWSKVTSNLWWPGRVYHPSNASVDANKVKEKDKILVAYFGDSSFAWCHPSQLKPLVEDFEEMAKQSGSKNFVNALHGSLVAVAKLVGIKMLCPCVPKENSTALGRTVAVNDGIKEEVLVPEGGLQKFPARLFEPSDCLSRLKGFAQLSEVDNMLEFTVLKSLLSAFYRAKGGRHLPAYHDPQPILGLDDGEVSSNNSGGQVEEEMLSPPVGPESQQHTQGVLQKCQEAPGDRSYQNRKQRSVAEIIETSTEAKTENREDTVAKKETATSGKKPSKVKRKKSKDGGEGGNAKGKDDVGDSAKSSPSAGKKRKIGGEDDSEKEKKAVDEPESGASKLKRKKAAELPESNELADISIASLVKDGSGVGNSHSEKKSKKETSGSEIGDSAEKKGKSTGGSQKERAANELTSGRRDRKKSRYLSFPYVSVKKEPMKEVTHAESVNISSEAEPEIRMTRSASKLGVPPVVKSGDGTPHSKMAKEHSQDGHKASASGPRKTKQDETKVSDPPNVKAQCAEILSQLRSKTRNPLRVEKENSLDKVNRLFIDFRSSIALDGTKEIDEQEQAGERRMSEKSGSAVSNKEQDLIESSSKTRKAKDAKSDDVSKEKEVADADTNDEDCAVLLILFNPASVLPTKDELVKTYEKYGALRLEGPETYDQKRRARIIFSKNSEAEAAFNDSQIVSPFPNAKATFRLQYLSNVTKTRKLEEISGANSSRANESGDPPVTPTAPDSTKLPAGVMSELCYVKEKLVGVAAVLGKPDGKITKNEKSKLYREINDVLEKVSAMVGSSP